MIFETFKTMLRSYVQNMILESSSVVNESLWSRLIEDITEKCWDNNYFCEEGKDRFDTKSLISCEIRFDEKDFFDIDLIKLIINNSLKKFNLKRHSKSKSSLLHRFGDDIILCDFDGNELVVVFDELIDKTNPFILLYVRPMHLKNRNIREGINERKQQNKKYITLTTESKNLLKRFFTSKFPDLSDWNIQSNRIEISDKIFEQLPKNKSLDFEVISSGIGEGVASLKVKIIDSKLDQVINKFNEKDFLNVVLASQNDESIDIDSIIDWHDIEKKIKISGYIREE